MRKSLIRSHPVAFKFFRSTLTVQRIRFPINETLKMLDQFTIFFSLGSVAYVVESRINSMKLGTSDVGQRTLEGSSLSSLFP